MSKVMIQIYIVYLQRQHNIYYTLIHILYIIYYIYMFNHENKEVDKSDTWIGKK